jgi:hypothetical protein
MIISHWIHLRIRKGSDESCRENHNTHFMFRNFFRKIVPFMRYPEKIWYGRINHRPQYNKVHAPCMLDDWGSKHKLRICNTYCFSTATMVTRTRLNVMLDVHCRSCLNQYLNVNLLKPPGYVMHQQFNIQQLYALPTLHLCVLYLSENKQRLVPVQSSKSYIISYRILYRVTCIRLVCKTYPWSDASTIRQKL